MGQEVLHRGSAMGHEDVITQLLSGMRSFLADSALVHANAAATQLDLVAKPHPRVVDFASSAARLRAHDAGRPALRGGMRAAQSAC
jgi:hypothetical protein